uniref:hypothetical protein n=1 Tax=Pedobacter schmidteae TaxID=2201271 RepID=UPI0013CEF69C|nr:hypothetical protein [Pedobacter schmidteae]
MKYSIPCSVALLTTMIISLSTTGTSRGLNVFKVASSLNDFVPLNYTQGAVAICPADGKVCYIIIPDHDVYTSAEVSAIGLPTSYVGLPKVDDFGTGGLGAQIQAAILAPGEVSTPINGRTIIERN